MGLAESSSLLTCQVGSAPAWLGLNHDTMLILSSHTQACVLPLGEKDAGSSAGAAAASGKINNVPLWAADVCLPCLTKASYLEHVGTDCSFLQYFVRCLSLLHGNMLLTCKMMCY